MVVCPHCNQSSDGTPSFCGSCGASLGMVSPTESRQYVRITEQREIEINVRNVPEAKLALKELKLLKKAFNTKKKEVVEQTRQIRAQYTDQVRQKGSKFRGGGTIGGIIRTFQTIDRDNARRNLANALAPYEEQRRGIEGFISAIEMSVLRVEAYILETSRN